jgi:hypothetical protein
MIAPCAVCRRAFLFNPYLVPSASVDGGERRPICRDCVDWANPQRIARGLEPIVVAPGAYDPFNESDEGTLPGGGFDYD